MVRIVEKDIQVAFPRGHHLHALTCQVPNLLERTDFAFRIREPERQWRQVRTILELVAEGRGNLKKLHFLLLPELVLPAEQIFAALELIERRFRPNTITIIGLEHISLARFRDLLCRYRADNREILAAVDRDLDAGEVEQVPVNSCLIACKEQDGRLRVFFEAKSHPFGGEEHFDARHDLYRGKVFPLFRCHPTCFNFMALICLDYVYRDLYQSNISVIIERANKLFFETRQRLDLLAVIECNPKPEHQAFRDVVNGFYGEYLEYTPGVRDAITLFCNSAAGTRCEGVPSGEDGFGHSSVIIHESHKLEQVQLSEFATDDFDGLPVCRLRFGSAPRLYFFNLPVFHELDPRTTRVPLKIHSIFRPTRDGGWTRMSSEELVGRVAGSGNLL
ncbi:hypothetical protein C2E25_14800 [Geothermobacter hydrogeniphilus]|uniref:Uncharacterized protein n=1 Tax=Geothermobacter hydrogeniphilus TaxID=1969733 RepID=A0A2K2H6Q9_9BACT|nr:hypothetical protein [Geothermobacter hydrogeniphilus]PNU19005.1 hypothetical protein C2E25_14800 [Geothermobacter hydrogeniphilus]